MVAALERKFWREREKELVNKLHIQATTDQLTGIYNRRVIFEALDEAMENSKQSKDRQFATIMFDIDFFKILVLKKVVKIDLVSKPIFCIHAVFKSNSIRLFWWR